MIQRLRNWQLFATCVLTWGTTWYVITFQVSHSAPEIGVALRFALAGVTVLAMCLWRGIPLRFTARVHARLALQGAFMYGVSYICVYHAERYVVSGLVAVGYSASPLISGLGARLLFGARLPRRFVLGSVFGLAGVALIFWPEFGKAAGGHAAALGALFTVASVLLSTVGSLIASRNGAGGLPLWPSLGFGMVYGALTCVLVAVLQGEPLATDTAALALPSWWASLLYLSLAGSVLTFACFLTLQERIGPGRAGAIGVMTPLLALLMSMLFEGFRPDALTFTGAAFAVLGNVLMLRRA